MENLAVKKNSQRLEAYIKQPRFYEKFHCIGGKCIYSCCSGGWNIDWKKNEIDKIRAADCSDELRELAENSFRLKDENKPNNYVVTLKENGECPFHTEDKMCLIQRELGEEYLSDTCRIYPRLHMVNGDRVTRTCGMSCIEAVNMICDAEDSMDIVMKKERIARIGHIDTDEMINKHPELRYRSTIFEFYYRLFSNNSQGIDICIIEGAMAARALSKAIEEGHCERIPELLEDYDRSLKEPDNIQAIMNIKPNYTYRIGVCAKLVDIAANPKIMKSMFNEDGSVAADRYFEAAAGFERYAADKPWLFRNIALNMLFECRMPFFHTDRTLYENFLYFAAAFAAVKMLGPAEVLMCRTNGNKLSPEMAFKCAMIVVSRRLFNNPGNFDVMLNALKEYDCMSPAKIALLLK